MNKTQQILVFLTLAAILFSLVQVWGTFDLFRAAICELEHKKADKDPDPEIQVDTSEPQNSFFP